MRMLPVGARALLVELDGPAEVNALHAEIELRRRDGRLPALEEVVPAAGTRLSDALADPAAFARDLSGWNVPPALVSEGHLIEVPTIYDGPDLANVAGAW